METGRLIANQIECFATLYKNPFLFAPILPTFYSELGQKDRSILLSYLVLPLLLAEPSRTVLSRLNKNSSLRTFVERRECFFGLGQRIASYRNLTNILLQYNLDMKWLIASHNATVVSGGALIEPGVCRPDMLRAAARLGRILSPHAIPVIYLQLGIKKL